MNPMMRESNTVLINNNVAENAECSCRGRNWRIARLYQLLGAAVWGAEDSATMSRFYTHSLGSMMRELVRWCQITAGVRAVQFQPCANVYLGNFLEQTHCLNPRIVALARMQAWSTQCK